MEFLGFDHIDLRVPSLALVESFYDRLMPRLGLGRKGYAKVAYAGAKWEGGTEDDHNAVEFFEVDVHGRPARFMGIIEEEDAQPARGRIAFAIAPGTLVEWERILREAGAHEIEPNHEVEYPAIFFADPGGTRLEVCARPPRP